MYSIYLFIWGLFGVASGEIYFKYYVNNEIEFIDYVIAILMVFAGPICFIVLINNIPKK